MGKAESSSPFL